MKIDSSKLIYGFFLSCAVAGLTYLGVTEYYKKELKFGEDNKQLLDTYDDVQKNFYRPVDNEQLEYDMIGGLIEGLDDRFSYYDSAKVGNEAYVNDSKMLKYNGFQISRDEKTKNILITDVEKGSNAEKLGMKENDLIVCVDGEEVQDKGYYNTIDLLLGEKDRATELICRRGAEDYTVNIERGERNEEEREVNSGLYDNGVYYYKFDSFDETSVMNFNSHIEGVDGIKGVILDLRENGGGNTESAVEFFDLFSGAGSFVKHVSARTNEEVTFKTTDNVRYDYPVAVLVSEETLSAAEILTAFFQSTGRGTVIGTQTGGKGVYQGGKTLDDMSMYAIVEGYYYVNDVPNYNNIGITPDIVIEMDDELRNTEGDIQLKKAMQLLS